MLNFEGKVVLVTGAASGIGRATAVLFAKQGASVVAADINLSGVQETIRRLEGPGTHMAILLDVAQEDAWKAAMGDIVDRLGKLDTLCNIAGIGFPGTIEELEIDQWNAMVAVNLTGPVLGCKHAVKTISESGGAGAIINVSSVAGLVGIADVAGYTATKGGVTTLTKAVALHCAQKGLPIRCTSIHPTYVDTEMLDPVAEAIGSREQVIGGMAALVPMKRVAKPEDIANAIVFAASDEAGMISGSAICVDGAQLAGPPSAHS